MGIENVPVIVCFVLVAIFVQDGMPEDQGTGYRLDQGA